MDLFRKKPINTILNDIKEGGGVDEHIPLKRSLTVIDLTAFGIAAIVGAGIFSTIGEASYSGGPAVILLFIFTAVACTFAGFAYAEFASMIPVSGSAYTYSYAAFGELIAWIIGWDLLIEYAIGNIAVAISWSDYFTSFLDNLRIPALGITNGIHLPEWMTMDYLSAYRGLPNPSDGGALIPPSGGWGTAYMAWTTAPTIGGFRLIADVPALVITFFITWLIYRGIKESKIAGNIMVLIKLIILIIVISIGAGYVSTGNWTPFAPNGLKGVMQGVAGVFFAYIGFDAISTTAEECKNPQRDLPRSMFYSIIICTILYCAIALVLTGMVNYKQFYNVGDPLSFAFAKLHMNTLSVIIAFSAIVATASVLLVFQLGQPRIWMSMSRDGLLPPVFARIHPKFKTPSFSTIVTGFMVAIPALFLNLSEVTALTSIGTLFAFVLVCGGVLKLQSLPNPPERKFKTPYINSKFVAPVILIISVITVWNLNQNAMKDFFSNRKLKDPDEFVKNLNDAELADIKNYLVGHHNDEFSKQTTASPVKDYLVSLTGNKYKEDIYEETVRNATTDEAKKFDMGWEALKHNIPMWIFLLISLLITYWCIKKSLSLIPVLGLISCLYLMAELGITNWYRFGIWLIIGLVVYFSYGYKNSKLNLKLESEEVRK